jgi:hypothetical protein
MGKITILIFGYNRWVRQNALPIFISNKKVMIQLIQKETTYEVEYNEETYSVTMLEDSVSLGYTQYDVYDENGEVVNGKLEEEIINYLEENV